MSKLSAEAYQRPSAISFPMIDSIGSESAAVTNRSSRREAAKETERTTRGTDWPILLQKEPITMEARETTQNNNARSGGSEEEQTQRKESESAPPSRRIV